MGGSTCVFFLYHDFSHGFGLIHIVAIASRANWVSLMFVTVSWPYSDFRPP